MTLDESFVTASASVIFIALSFKYCKVAINSMIKNRIQDISEKLKETQQIKNESEVLLNEQQSLYNSSKIKVNDILSSAKDEINKLKEKAELDLELQLQNKTKTLQNILLDQERKYITNLRLEALRLAISTSIFLFRTHNKQNRSNKLNIEILDIMSHQLK